MKKLSEIADDILLTVTPNGHDGTVIDKSCLLYTSLGVQIEALLDDPKETE